MKLSYERDMAHNYMIPETEGTVEVQSWQVQMLTENQISGLLRCIVKRVNGRNRYCYEITSRQSMAQIYETRVMRIGEIRKILGCLYRTLRETENYLLDVERIVLEPECIYMDIETGETWFCYLPEYQTDLKEAIRKLTSWFLRHLDQHDPTSVLQGYELYRKAMEQQGSIQELLRFAMALSAEEGPVSLQREGTAGWQSFENGNPGQEPGQENGAWNRESAEGQFGKDPLLCGTTGLSGKDSLFGETAGRFGMGSPVDGTTGQNKEGFLFDETAGRFAGKTPFGSSSDTYKRDSSGEAANPYRTTSSSGNLSAGASGKKAFFSGFRWETFWLLPGAVLLLAAVLTITGALAEILTWTQAGEIMFLAAGLTGYCISVITRKQKEEKEGQGDLAFKREEKAERARQKREKKFARKQKKTEKGQQSGGISENGKRISGISEMTTMSDLPGSTTGTNAAPGLSGGTTGTNAAPGLSGGTTGMTAMSGLSGGTTGMTAMSGLSGGTTGMTAAPGLSGGTTGMTAAPGLSGTTAGMPGTGKASDLSGTSEPVVGATTLLWEGEESYKPHLTLISMNSRDRQSVVLLNDSYLIGKLKSNVDIRINDPSVSRIHARIQKEGDEYFLQDLNATNGTFLNGRRLEVQEKVRIQEGDEITFAEIGYYVGRC